MNFYLLFLFCTCVNVHLAETVKVSVYYEALCYDSVDFIARQLYPNYHKLKDHIQLELIPYGKAAHFSSCNKWIFMCQHGPKECLANKYQACILAQANGQDKDAATINCIMTQRKPSDVSKIEMCVKRQSLNWGKISKCAQSSEGDNFLAKFGDKTLALDPNLSFVPTVIYNDQYDDFLQERSLTDFAAVVCSKIEGDKPEICKTARLPEKRSFYDY